jgi:hypothetical protein
MNPLSLSPAARQNALARSMYRKLFRECQRLPPNASLAHLDQWVEEIQIEDRDTLRSCLKSSFRRPNKNDDLGSISSNNNQNLNTKNPENKEEIEGKGGIQRAMEGLKYLQALDLSKLSESENEARVVSQKDDETERISNNEEQDSYSLHSPISSYNLLRSVEWLPHVSEMTVAETKSAEFPLFPLWGPLFGDEGRTLPPLSGFLETPVHGLETPIRIVEPRYLKMYQDLLSSADPSSRKFIVPFPHPYRPGKFAAFGWMYEIVRAEDEFEGTVASVLSRDFYPRDFHPRDFSSEKEPVSLFADAWNCISQRVCHHIVTQPVKIHGIINPEDHDTKSTYLRVRADIHCEDEYNLNTPDTNSIHREKPRSEDLQPLQKLLQQLLSSDNNNRQIDKAHIGRLLKASGEGSIWRVVQVYILNLKAEIIQLQMKIATRIEVLAKSQQQRSSSTNSNNNDDMEWKKFITNDMVPFAQGPYKSHLRSMLIEVSTLIPWLLQEESHKARCHLMCERIRERSVNDSLRFNQW